MFSEQHQSSIMMENQRTDWKYYSRATNERIIDYKCPTVWTFTLVSLNKLFGSTLAYLIPMKRIYDLVACNHYKVNVSFAQQVTVTGPDSFESKCNKYSVVQGIHPIIPLP